MPDAATHPAATSDTMTAGGHPSIGGTVPWQDPRKRKVNLDSTSHRVEVALVDATGRTRHGVSLIGIHAEYERRFGAVARKSVASTLASGLLAGWCYKTGGLPGNTRYAHATHPVPDVPDLERMAIVHAVKEGVAAEGRALTIKEIRERLAVGGHALAAETLRKRLETLSTTTPKRASECSVAWHAPELQRHAVAALDGQPHVHWSPAGSTVPVPVPPPTLVWALQQAIAHVERRINRPVTRKELAWWARATAGTAVTAGDDEHVRRLAEVVTASHLKVNFNNIAARVMTGHDARGFSILMTPFAVSNVTRVRVGAGPVSDRAQAQCLVEDLAKFIRPSDELMYLAALDALATTSRCAALTALASDRRRLLARVLMQYLPESVPPHEPATWYALAAMRALPGLREVQRWVAAGGATNSPGWRDMTLERLVNLERQVRTLTALETVTLPLDGPPPDALSIVEAAGVLHEDMGPLAREALVRAHQSSQNWRWVLASARRVYVVPPQDRRVAGMGRGGFWVDRVDAMTCVARHCHLPRLNALLSNALAVTGCVLRDPALLQATLQELSERDAVPRRALTLALGLLGQPPALELACPDPSDPEDAAAYAAAVGLGIDRQDERERLLRLADRRSRGSARAMTARAYMQMEEGKRLTVIG